MNVKLEAALAYARMRWRIFPLHSIVDGTCTCGKKCNSPGKHPRTKRGFKDATDDPEQIRKWWGKWSGSNIGVATGSGLVVLDIDGSEGAAQFKELVAAHGPPPETLVSQTGNGFHLVYQLRPDSPEVRSSARGKVHVRGEGGYIVAPPSDHASGRQYRWVRKCKIATLPDWLRQWSQGYEISGVRTITDLSLGDFGPLGQLPAYLQSNQHDSGKTLSKALETTWTPSEEARLVSALSAIDVNTCNYDDFLKIGMALNELGWERSDGTSIAFDLWDGWCSQSEHYNPEGLEAKWRSFGRTDRVGVSLGTVYHMARERGWSGLPDPPSLSKVNGASGAHALPAAFVAASQAIFFPDVNEDGKPRHTCLNCEVAIRHVQIACEKDQFHEKMFAGGHMIERWEGELTDEVIQMLRKMIRTRFGFDPGEKNVRDACIQLCLENQFDPLLDYLNGLTWDGTSRLDSWLVRYMGAADTELNRTIGRLVLIAAVRRQFKPATKFDQIIVLESKEGFGKSTAIEILAGSDNFSDQPILNKNEREQQEAMTGVWLYEIADLTGMKRADIEHIKSFASRTVDRARPAYGRFREDRPRRTIFFATTNDADYLQSQTGNRRFWPVPVGRIDLAGLTRDRDQLWAEAVMREKRGDSLGLPERLWHVAAEEQEQRQARDSWLEGINNYVNMADKYRNDVNIAEVLVDNQFIQRKPDQIGRTEQIRAGHILRQLGFERYRKRIGPTFCWRYKRIEV